MIADTVACGGTKNGDNITFPVQNGNTSKYPGISKEVTGLLNNGI